MADLVTRGIFDGLVRRAGGVEVVASVLEARYGTGCKGTISKMCAGHLGVTVDAVVALEDFLGVFPITGRMFERTGREGVRHGSLHELAAQSTIASGQAHAALIRAFSHLSDYPAGLTDRERADVISSMRAARQIITDIIETAEAYK
ncbi:hypothetical protein [Pseudogemmobacter sp. W21_MBD1_M6]|uniref:hypothetical protein n=1 Tax=Pseudogemmobacter sp. W21_MBD1_M6 TaxID=3240271 RepID=UPI003F950D10